MTGGSGGGAWGDLGGLYYIILLFIIIILIIIFILVLYYDHYYHKKDLGWRLCTKKEMYKTVKAEVSRTRSGTGSTYVSPHHTFLFFVKNLQPVSGPVIEAGE